MHCRSRSQQRPTVKSLMSLSPYWCDGCPACLLKDTTPSRFSCVRDEKWALFALLAVCRSIFPPCTLRRFAGLLVTSVCGFLLAMPTKKRERRTRKEKNSKKRPIRRAKKRRPTLRLPALLDFLGTTNWVTPLRKSARCNKLSTGIWKDNNFLLPLRAIFQVIV